MTRAEKKVVKQRLSALQLAEALGNVVDSRFRGNDKTGAAWSCSVIPAQAGIQGGGKLADCNRNPGAGPLPNTCRCRPY